MVILDISRVLAPTFTVLQTYLHFYL